MQQSRNSRDPCSSGSRVVDWLYKNVSIDANAQGGLYVGGTGSVDMNLRQVSGDGGGGGGYFGADAHMDVDIQVSGPELSDGFYRSYSICGGVGIGGCVTFNFQNGAMSTAVSLGANAGLSASASLLYQKTILPPARFPGTPESCTRKN